MKLLSVQEVAETIKVSDKTVRRLIKRGTLTAYKIGARGQLRIKENDLEQFVESNRVEVAETAQTNTKLMESGE